jgi:arylsulfatase A-like enzyme
VDNRTPTWQRAARAAALGLLLGCLAGVLTALTDYGAHWLWLDRWADRGSLLLRLVGIQAPLGGLLGAVLGLLIGISDAWIERFALPRGVDGPGLHALRALCSTLLMVPALASIGALLFSGGMMSRLPGRHALQPLALMLLCAGAWGGLCLAHRLEAATRSSARARVRLAWTAAAFAFVIAKLNQWVLPKLYDYLHAALAGLAFFSFVAALLLLGSARTCYVNLSRRLWIVALSAGVPLLALWLAWTIGSLDRNQNVRVALLDPNVPHSRAVMQALAPIVIEPAQRRATQQARAKARSVRAERRKAPASAAGPALDDAHILLITVDALRADHLGTYGYPRPTSPNLDRFAQQSVVFERAYAPAPHSSFSLCSMMTSEYLHETLDLGHPAPTQTLASELAAAGYHTAAFYTAGIFHTAAERLQPYERDAFGFALHDPVKYPAAVLTDRVLAEVDRTLARGEPNSLFWVHYFDVHEPYQDTYFGSSDMDRYDSEIRKVDAQIERLVREVRKRLSRDVIVAISADHGEEFYEHGGVYHGSSLYDEQVRIPLIINAPGLPPARIAAPVESIDLAPSLLEWVGLQAPSSMRGHDLRSAAQIQPSSSEPVFSAVIHKKMILRWPHKLIADLRFGLFELYDLEHDPRERQNLADHRPELLADLRSELYDWLDSLALPSAGDRALAALDWGRLGDRRAVEPLAKMLTDTSLPEATRVEAARMLGHLADERAATSLLAAMNQRASPNAAAEAAIALGRMYDDRARASLSQLVSSEDATVRVRAAVSLGRLRDRRAVPALIDALWIAPSDYERQEAVRWLGRLRDPRALEPLIRLLPEVRTRYLVPIALGMIGDERAYDPLVGVLTWDNHADVRDATIQGLGMLGDRRAIPLIVPLVVADPALKFATESLVRLGAIQRGSIGGADAPVGSPSSEFVRCQAGPLIHDWDYLHRTSCQTRRNNVSITLAVPTSVAMASQGVLAALSIKRVDGDSPVPLQVTIGSYVLQPFQVDGSWHEHHFVLPAGFFARGRARAHLSSNQPDARFELDHVLLLPRTNTVLATN